MTRRATRLALALLLASGCGNDGAGDTSAEDMAGADMSDMHTTEDMPPDTEPDEGVADTTAPTVSIGSGMIASEEGAYTLEGAVMDDVGVVAVRYTLNDGEAQALAVGATFSQALTLPSDPTTIEVFAEDAAGNVGEATITVGFEPARRITPSFTVTTVSDGSMTPLRYEHLRFDASGTANPEDKTLTYTWDFGDGHLVTDRALDTIRHRYVTANTYTVRLVVEADDGEEATAERMITVAESTPQGTATLLGMVTDDDGGPLADVRIIDRDGVDLGGTDARGRYQATVPRGVPVALRLHHSQYTEQVVRLLVDPADDRYELDASLKRRNDPVYLEDAATGGAVRTSEGVQIDFPANSLVNELTGQPVSGTVAIIATPVDMTQGGASLAFPGTYDGVLDAGTIEPIASLGVVEVELLQDGAPVQIAPGAQVTLDIPIHQDATPNDIIPLWSLDPLTGQWVDEGEGTVASRAGRMVLESRVRHFSWWNADVLATGLFADARVSFVNEDGSPYNPTDTAAREPRVSVLTPSAPARPIYRRIRMENGANILPDPLPMPIGRAAELEVIAYDATADTLRYSIEPLGITPDDPAPAVEVVLLEVGGPRLPLITLPTQDAPETVTLARAWDTQFFETELSAGQALEIAATATGTGRIIVRSSHGEPLLDRPFGSFTPGDVLFAPAAPGRYLVQVRPDRAAPGSVTIGANTITPPTISPGQNLSETLLPDSFTRDFIITANKNEELFSRLTATSMGTWDVKLLAPNGRQLGTFSTADYGTTPGTFNPINAPSSNGYRLRVSGSPSSGDGTGDFEVVLSDVERYSGRFTTNGSQTITGFIGDPTQANRPGKIHRYDFAAKPDHEVYVRLQRMEPDAQGVPRPAPELTAPRLTVTGANVFESQRVFDPETGTSHLIARVSSGSDITTGLIWVAMPNADTANYALTVEQRPRTPHQISQITVGDCAGATMRALPLARGAIAPGGEITLCPTPDPHMPHELINALDTYASVKGQPGQMASTIMQLVQGASIRIRGDDALPPATLEEFTIAVKAAQLGALITITGDQATTLRKLHLWRDGTFDNGLSEMSAINVNLTNSALIPLTLDEIDIDAGFSDGITLAGPLALMMTDVTLGSTTRQGVSYGSTIHGSTLHVEGCDLSTEAVSGAALTLATAGDITVHDNRIRQHDTTNTNFASLILHLHQSTDGARHTLSVTQNTLTTDGGPHGGIDLSLKGSNQDLVFARNTYDATGHAPGQLVKPLTLTTGSGSVNHTARVENNVFIGHTHQVTLGDAQAFGSLLFQHNSLAFAPRTANAPTSVIALEGASASPQLVNNALAMSAPHGFPAVAAEAGVTPVLTNNLIHNVSANAYTPSASFTVAGEQVVAPQWDPATLTPLLNSPLLGAGAASSATDDLLGATRGNPPSIGAYEAAAPAP
jgi:hypothetical protein